MRVRTTSLLSIVLLASALAGCGDRQAGDARRGSAAAGEATLPVPSAAGGVTGSATVAPGGTAPELGGGAPVIAPVDDQAAVALGPDGLPLTPAGEAGMPVPTDASGLADPDTGLAAVASDGAPPPANGAPEPTTADAVAVLRDYYAAINARNFGRAYALWSGGGRASGQTPEQFAGGYAQTQGVSVTLGAPGPQDAGAGQRYVQVPVALRATQADGSVKRYAGSFTLHRAVADGASADQRAWRIRNADLREVAE